MLHQILPTWKSVLKFAIKIQRTFILVYDRLIDEYNSFSCFCYRFGQLLAQNFKKLVKNINVLDSQLFPNTF